LANYYFVLLKNEGLPDYSITELTGQQHK